MGMTYSFWVAKKGSIPDGQDFEDLTGWLQISDDLDREDWIHTFLNYDFSEKSFIDAIEKLEQLDKDVYNILKKEDLDIGFRARLAEGLVTRVYGHRYYHYRFPREYYPKGQEYMGDPLNEDWLKYGGSTRMQEEFKKMIPYANEEYQIKLLTI